MARTRSSKVTVASQNDKLLLTFRHLIVGLVRQGRPDLSARQMGVFLTCYLDEIPQTVRGRISRPVISRALDRLSAFDLIRRKPDPTDRRSVLAQRTTRGTVFLASIRSTLADAEKE